MNEPPPAGTPVITARIKGSTRPARAATGPGALKRGRSGGQASGQAGSARVAPTPTGASTSPRSSHHFRPLPARQDRGTQRPRPEPSPEAEPPALRTRAPRGALPVPRGRARALPAPHALARGPPARPRPPRPALPATRPHAPPAARTRTHRPVALAVRLPAPRPQSGSRGAPPGPGRTPFAPAPSPHLLGPGAAAPHSSSSFLPHGWWQRRQRRLRPWGQGDGRPGRK